jgi:hypothetical protein
VGRRKVDEALEPGADITPNPGARHNSVERYGIFRRWMRLMTLLPGVAAGVVLGVLSAMLAIWMLFLGLEFERRGG